MSQENKKALIKKYTNRRLYDTSESRYITLEDLANKVQKGTDIQVVDAKTGKDLTRQVLTQVILEQGDRLDVIPVELLHGIIRVQGTIQQAPFTAFLSTMASGLSDTGASWAQQMNQFFGGFGAPTPAAPSQEQAVPQEEPASEPQADSKAAPQEGELSDLRKRMDELLARLGNEKKD